MRYPTIHRNGTAREDLIRQYERATRAVHDAIDAVRHIECHGRDYYVQASVGRDPTCEAHSEHCARIQALEKVRSELELLWTHCVDSGNNR